MSTTPLPPLHARWIESAIGTELPAETRATCDHCAMLPDGDSGPIPPEPIFTRARCCTYHPSLHNFLVGLILADASPEAAVGRDRVRAAIRERRGATPLGLRPDAAWSLRYDAASRHDRFGRADELACPYLSDDDRCSIWRHRNAVCATWFCKYVDGHFGMELWTPLRGLLMVAEEKLALHCLVTLAPDATAIDELWVGTRKARPPAPATGADGRIDAGLARRLWGPWFGREEELYLACGELVAAMDWANIRAVCGPDLARAEILAREAVARAAAPRRTETLYAIRIEHHPLENGRVSLRSPLVPYDPVRVSPEIAGALHEFDGRPTAEVLPLLARRGIDLDEALIGRLMRHGVLLAPDGRDPLPAPLTPVAPGDRLAFFKSFARLEPGLEKETTAEGRCVVHLTSGSQHVSFDEPDLLTFGEELYHHRHGFTADDARGWVADSSETLSWERVAEMLDALLAERILVKLPGIP